MSQTRFLKSMITPTLVEPTTGDAHIAGVASGVWSVQDQLEAKRGGAWPDASVANPDEFIENNFSTTLYTGDASSRNIENNINLSGKGGLVWIKDRTIGKWHKLFDTERGVNNALFSNESDAQSSVSSTLTAFNSNGFTLGAGGAGNNNSVNEDTRTYCAWTFKKAPKFFDIVTYTGTGSAQAINHNLGSVPGAIFIKSTSNAFNWIVYHRGIDGSAPEDYFAYLDLTNARTDLVGAFNDTAPTSTQFTVNTTSACNFNGGEFVAYIFAHETGDDSMIQCGSYTGNGNATGPVIDLGFEPQWIMVKNAGNTGSWVISDVMRGFDTVDTQCLIADDAASESSADIGHYAEPTSTGFKLLSSSASSNQNNTKYIYMAIRRPNMATITDATKVFAMDSDGSALVNGVALTSGFPVDMVFHKELTGTDAGQIASRLQGSGNYVQTSSTAAEASGVTYGTFDHNDGFFSTPVANMAWMWKRAKGFFDVTCYTGNATNPQDVNHSLGVVPEMVWHKKRSATSVWKIWHKDAQAGGDEEDGLQFDDSDSPYADAFYTVDITGNSGYIRMGNTGSNFNGNGITYVMYLFATLAGVSKVGSVTHSGSSTDVDCGFSAGARFVLIKRIDDTGDWYVWDSVRGIIAGNDPYLLLNDAAAQVTNTDLIDPLASGFQISGDFTDGDYIFYAIA